MTRWPWETMDEWLARVLPGAEAGASADASAKQADVSATVELARHGLDEGDLIRVRGMGVRL